MIQLRYCVTCKVMISDTYKNDECPFCNDRLRVVKYDDYRYEYTDDYETYYAEDIPED